MLKAVRISCPDPKLSDAQTRNFEAIKHTAPPRQRVSPNMLLTVRLKYVAESEWESRRHSDMTPLDK